MGLEADESKQMEEAEQEKDVGNGAESLTEDAEHISGGGGGRITPPLSIQFHPRRTPHPLSHRRRREGTPYLNAAQRVSSLLVTSSSVGV